MAQGTVSFTNYRQGLNAPVFQPDGITKLSGPNYVAQLMAGPSADSMQLVGSPVPFLTGSAAGYFVGEGIAIPNVPHGATAYCCVVAWDSTLGGTTTGAAADAAFAFQLGSGLGIWGVSGGYCWGGGNPYTPFQHSQRPAF
ncbi:MAG TPA: hypothetical protein VG167_16665 [Verrucomicrobiae bacterium]|nr:hypothetical protein [Verrucomicrobiae bacterium]